MPERDGDMAAALEQIRQAAGAVDRTALEDPDLARVATQWKAPRLSIAPAGVRALLRMGHRLVDAAYVVVALAVAAARAVRWYWPSAQAWLGQRLGTAGRLGWRAVSFIGRLIVIAIVEVLLATLGALLTLWRGIVSLLLFPLRLVARLDLVGYLALLAALTAIVVAIALANR